MVSVSNLEDILKMWEVVIASRLNASDRSTGDPALHASGSQVRMAHAPTSESSESYDRKSTLSVFLGTAVHRIATIYFFWV